MRVSATLKVAVVLFLGCDLRADAGTLTAEWMFFLEPAPGVEIVKTDSKSVDGSNAIFVDEQEVRDGLRAGFKVRGQGYNLGIEYQAKVDADLTGGSYVEGSLSYQDRVTLFTQDRTPVNVDAILDLFGDPSFLRLAFNWVIEGSVTHEPSDSGFVGGSARTEASLFAGIELTSVHSDAEWFGYGGKTFPFEAPPTFGVLGTMDNQGQFTIGAAISFGAGAGAGSVRGRFLDTLKLTSITFPDGSTPEDHGLSVEFESGMPSPNIPVPEPSSLAIAVLAALAFGILMRKC